MNTGGKSKKSASGSEVESQGGPLPCPREPGILAVGHGSSSEVDFSAAYDADRDRSAVEAATIATREQKAKWRRKPSSQSVPTSPTSPACWKSSTSMGHGLGRKSKKAEARTSPAHPTTSSRTERGLRRNKKKKGASMPPHGEEETLPGAVHMQGDILATAQQIERSIEPSFDEDSSSLEGPLIQGVIVADPVQPLQVDQAAGIETEAAKAKARDQKARMLCGLGVVTLVAAVIAGAVVLAVFLRNKAISNQPMESQPNTIPSHISEDCTVFAVPTESMDDADAIFAVDDTYIRGGSKAELIYGNDTRLIVKKDAQDLYDRKTFLKFDMSKLSESDPSAFSDTAELSLEVQNTPFDGSLETERICLHKMASSTWAEDSLTWSTSDKAGLSTPESIIACDVVAIRKDVSRAVFFLPISLIENEVSLQDEVTFRLTGEVDTTNIVFTSKECGKERGPRLTFKIRTAL